MDSKIEQLLPLLQKLKQPIISQNTKTIYLLCGNQKAGKNTFAHYLLQTQIIYQIDQEGQDILTITNPVDKIVIVDNLIEIIPCFEKQILFIKFVGFVSQSKSLEEKEEWVVAFDYLMKVLSMKQQAMIKFILIFSLQQLQEDDQIFVKYYNSFRNVPDFVARTHFVLSKLVDQDQFHEFVERTAQDIKQSKQNCEYIDQVIKSQRVYGFYSRDVDQAERNQFIQNLMGTQVSTKMNLQQESALIHRTMQESGLDLNSLYQKMFSQLKICLQIVNLSYLDILFNGCKIQNKQITKLLKKTIQKIYGNDFTYQLNNFIGDKKNFENFVKNYAQFIDVSKKTPQLLVKLFMKKISLLQFNYSQTIKKHNFIARCEILVLLCKGLSQKNSEQFLQNQELCNIFINNQNGAFQDHFLAKVFQKTKPYFTPQFIKTYEKIASSPPKKKIKKIKPKNIIPNYDEQKKLFQSKPKTLTQIQQLVSSPLKLDLLLEQLQKKRKNKTRTIKQQKKIIRQVIKLLELYGCIEQATRFALVLPDIYAVQAYAIRYINQLKLQKDLNRSQQELIETITKFYSTINRLHYLSEIYQALKILLHKFTQQQQRNKPILKKLVQNLQNLQLPQQSLSIQQTQASIRIVQIDRKQLLKYFMNYNTVNDIMSKKQTIIEKCINYEAQNPQVIQLQLVKQWVMQSGQIKVL